MIKKCYSKRVRVMKFKNFFQKQKPMGITDAFATEYKTQGTLSNRDLSLQQK